MGVAEILETSSGRSPSLQPTSFGMNGAETAA
jgi:hypothetical protein